MPRPSLPGIWVQNDPCSIAVHHFICRNHTSKYKIIYCAKCKEIRIFWKNSYIIANSLGVVGIKHFRNCCYKNIMSFRAEAADYSLITAKGGLFYSQLMMGIPLHATCHLQDITSWRKIHFSHGEADEVRSLHVDTGSIYRPRVQTRSFGVIHVCFKWVYRQNNKTGCFHAVWIP